MAGSTSPVSVLITARVRKERAVINTETGEFEPAALYDRSALAAGEALSGPAVIVEKDTATVVSAAFDALIHPHGHIILTRKGQSS